ncbi:hypothetical protein MOQ72_29235 [Saccharopolyspora sp. K220]|uniref:hypothetical protein n=1 Tax=Saccharopolyspora soli TaxID=2926618 RepID=UPI001F582446|nr:hypothetical protein [Saccharopolyspora soli]MCI2421526.1 hypothetical protein [Saccharopolyspora soli]
MSDRARLARLMRMSIVMLASAVDDIERDRWTPADCLPLAAGLDELSAALRATANPELVRVDSKRADR